MKMFEPKKYVKDALDECLSLIDNTPKYLVNNYHYDKECKFRDIHIQVPNFTPRAYTKELGFDVKYQPTEYSRINKEMLEKALNKKVINVLGKEYQEFKIDHTARKRKKNYKWFDGNYVVKEKITSEDEINAILLEHAIFAAMYSHSFECSHVEYKEGVTGLEILQTIKQINKLAKNYRDLKKCAYLNKDYRLTQAYKNIEESLYTLKTEAISSLLHTTYVHITDYYVKKFGIVGELYKFDNTTYEVTFKCEEHQFVFHVVSNDLTEEKQFPHFKTLPEIEKVEKTTFSTPYSDPQLIVANLPQLIENLGGLTKSVSQRELLNAILYAEVVKLGIYEHYEDSVYDRETAEDNCDCYLYCDEECYESINESVNSNYDLVSFTTLFEKETY